MIDPDPNEMERRRLYGHWSGFLADLGPVTPEDEHWITMVGVGFVFGGLIAWIGGMLL